MAANARIAVSGSIATDHLMHFPGRFAEQLIAEQLHQISLSFLADDLEIHRGGVGANIAYAMGVLGSAPLLVGAVGKDFDEYRAWLERHGVDCSAVYVSDTKHTARFVSTADDDMCQISTFYAGAMSQAGEIRLAPIAEQVGGLGLVVIAPDDPEAMLHRAQECREQGYTFAVDPSQQLARMDGEQVRRFIDGAEYLFTNAYEWELLLQKSGWTEAQVAERVGLRVTTLAEEGAQLVGRDGTDLKVSAVPAVRTANPTGAGDGFRGGFLAAAAAGLSLERSAQLGALIGVLSFETVGGQDWTYDRASMLSRLSDAYGAEAATEIGAFLPA
ncbi:carbohydrate kinase family protein [Amycolatopsis nigrescens]|uniref:carbohydrate kinase family protein n=1 Tax=Amycolatopsis nigrescens TaxID=381445 RepID=UPI0003671510|nr:carbohydrate kinase family protein [Amycolatopsis nigrescens]